jgi:predicted amidohydrolase YtcJ
MRPRVFLSAVSAALLLAACAKQPADVVLVNGKVLTVDREFSVASAVAVKDGKIIAVGGDEVARNHEAPTTIDLGGRVLMPGFIDTHVHIVGRSRRDVDLSGAKSIAELQAIVRAKAVELGAGEWVTGFAWDEAKFAEQRNPTRADLDAAAPMNPVALVRAGAHSIVGNSLAISIAAINRDTPDPDNGLIERDETGEPNGVVRERNDLFLAHVPSDTWKDVRGSYIDALKAVLPLGVTSVIEASGSIDDEPVGQGGRQSSSSAPVDIGRGTFRNVRAVYDEVGDQLPRMAMYISYPGAERLRQFPHATGYGDDRLRLGPIGETAVDGGFTGPTAWTLDDYKGLPGFRGKGRFTDEELQEIVNVSAERGWQLGLHAIGDAAIAQTVRAYSHAIRNVLPAGKDHRWFLDHFTMTPPEETMTTMAADRILIAQQPNFTYTLEARYAQTLDDKRLARVNPIAVPVKRHALFVALGSDNLPIGPMVGLYAAVTRKGQSGTLIGPEEAVTIEEAIRMYTANGAYLTWEEDSKGTIEVGKLADMIVLDADPLTIPAEDLLEINVDLTMVGGKVVYERAR